MSAPQIYTFLCLGQENTGVACLQLLLSCCPGSQLSLLLQKTPQAMLSSQQDRASRPGVPTSDVSEKYFN